jgi:hypothetical protein
MISVRMMIARSGIPSAGRWVHAFAATIIGGGILLGEIRGVLGWAISGGNAEIGGCEWNESTAVNSGLERLHDGIGAKGIRATPAAELRVDRVLRIDNGEDRVLARMLRVGVELLGDVSPSFVTHGADQ